MICVKNLVKTTKPPMVGILSLSKDQSSIYVLFDLWFIGVEAVSPSVTLSRATSLVRWRLWGNPSDEALGQSLRHFVPPPFTQGRLSGDLR